MARSEKPAIRADASHSNMNFNPLFIPTLLLALALCWAGHHYAAKHLSSILVSNVLEDFTVEIMDLMQALNDELTSFADLGIDLEEKAFYDILKDLARKYDFEYPEDKLLALSKEVKALVDDKAKYTDWNQREDIKAELKVHLILLLAKHKYPPVDQDEVYREIFEQAENYKRHQGRSQ